MRQHHARAAALLAQALLFSSQPLYETTLFLGVVQGFFGAPVTYAAWPPGMQLLPTGWWSLPESGLARSLYMLI